MVQIKARGHAFITADEMGEGRGDEHKWYKSAGLGLVMDKDEMVMKRTAVGFPEPALCGSTTLVTPRVSNTRPGVVWCEHGVAQHTTRPCLRGLSSIFFPLLLSVSRGPVLQKVCESMGLFKVHTGYSSEGKNTLTSQRVSYPTLLSVTEHQYPWNSMLLLCSCNVLFNTITKHNYKTYKPGGLFVAIGVTWKYIKNKISIR